MARKSKLKPSWGQLHSCSKHTEHLLLWVPHLRVLDFFFLFLLANYRAKLLCMHAKLLSRVQLCTPMDRSPPGSAIYGILQTRILEWVAMISSRRSFQPRDQTRICLLHWQAGSLTLAPPRKPPILIMVINIARLSVHKISDIHNTILPSSPETWVFLLSFIHGKTGDHLSNCLVFW